MLRGDKEEESRDDEEEKAVTAIACGKSWYHSATITG